MKNMLIHNLAIAFVGAMCVAVVATGDEGSNTERGPDDRVTLESTLTYLKNTDSGTISTVKRKQLLADVKTAIDLARINSNSRIKKNVRDVLVCLDWLSKYSEDDLHEGFKLRQQITLNCLSLSDAMPVEYEYQLMTYLPLGSEKTIDKDGPGTAEKPWPILRNEVLERRFHLLRRINNGIDPLFDPLKIDPKELPTGNILPLGGGIAGMSPNDIKDPVARAQYQAAIDDNYKKAERLDEQLELFRLRERYADILKHYIAECYGRPPVSQNDLDMLKAYLRIYVVDKKLRNELFGVAESAAKGQPKEVSVQAKDK